MNHLFSKVPGQFLPAKPVDDNSPRVTLRGTFPGHRTLYARFPKAFTPGLIALSSSQMGRHAFEVLEGRDQSYELVLRTLERRGTEAVLADFEREEDAVEAMLALERALERRVKKRWILGGSAAFLFVLLFMPLPSGKSSSMPTAAQRQAVMPAPGIPRAPGMLPSSPQSMPMPAGAFPSPMAPGAAPAPGAPAAPAGGPAAAAPTDVSSLPLPTPGIFQPPGAAPSAALPQAVPAPAPALAGPAPVGTPSSVDDDPFGLKMTPGAPPVKR